jgi:hypothetical protein
VRGRRPSRQATWDVSSSVCNPHPGFFGLTTSNEPCTPSCTYWCFLLTGTRNGRPPMLTGPPRIGCHLSTTTRDGTERHAWVRSEGILSDKLAGTGLKLRSRLADSARLASPPYTRPFSSRLPFTGHVFSLLALPDVRGETPSTRAIRQPRAALVHLRLRAAELGRGRQPARTLVTHPATHPRARRGVRRHYDSSDLRMRRQCSGHAFS